ncbi:hypothetical protein PRIPAC_77603, partial [Pristionchus pacificus]|uniref:Uncharacterized protein n=1 Tax=Pristionchus pacificus TaxID=54126 RepID=A0A2A6BVK2_PRIPA
SEVSTRFRRFQPSGDDSENYEIIKCHYEGWTGGQEESVPSGKWREENDQPRKILSSRSEGVSEYSPGWFPPENNPARPAPTGPKRPHAFLWLSRAKSDGAGTAQNINSLKLSDSRFLRVLITMVIFIFHVEPPLAPDDIRNPLVEPNRSIKLENCDIDVTSSGANGGSTWKMNITIVISTLKNLESETVPTPSDFARLYRKRPHIKFLYVRATKRHGAGRGRPGRIVFRGEPYCRNVRMKEQFSSRNSLHNSVVTYSTSSYRPAGDRSQDASAFFNGMAVTFTYREPMFVPQEALRHSWPTDTADSGNCRC